MDELFGRKGMHQRMAGWLELHNGKLLRAVLRGRGRRKVPELPGDEWLSTKYHRCPIPTTDLLLSLVLSWVSLWPRF
jgi:hypothetical protein